MTTLSLARADNYRQAAGKTNHLRPEVQQAAIQAMNACRPFIKKGFLRIEGNAVKVVTQEAVKSIPSIDRLVLYVGPQQAVEFLAQNAGIARVANKLPDFGDNPF